MDLGVEELLISNSIFNGLKKIVYEGQSLLSYELSYRSHFYPEKPKKNPVENPEDAININKLKI